MTTALVTEVATFLLARLAEEEKVYDDALWYTDADGTRIRPRVEGDVDAVKRRTFARELAEITAQRRIAQAYIARHEDVDLMLGPDCLRQREWSGLRYALHLLAEPYRDHPDYQQEWDRA